MSDKDIQAIEEEGRSIIEMLGDCACPTPGCTGRGQHVRIFDYEMRTGCEACVERSIKEDEQYQREQHISSLLERSGGRAFPLMFDWTLDTYPKDENGLAARQAAEHWLSAFLETDPKERRPNLILSGPIGSGKTGLAWGLARTLIEQYEIEVKFCVFHDLLAQMKESFQKKIPFDAYTAYARVPVLVVDDVGAERPTAWTTAELLTLVDRRYQRNRPMIVTSNYAPSELGPRISGSDEIVGQRIISRMIDGAIQIHLTAQDRRGPREPGPHNGD